MASFGATSQATASMATPVNTRHRAPSNGAPLASAAAANRMLWPSTHAASFSRVATNHTNAQPARMMRPPEVYVATHDTMPPQAQVIRTVATHDVLRQLYQQTDRKMTGKRDSTPDASMQGELRPAKTPRAN